MPRQSETQRIRHASGVLVKGVMQMQEVHHGHLPVDVPIGIPDRLGIGELANSSSRTLMFVYLPVPAVDTLVDVEHRGLHSES